MNKTKRLLGYSLGLTVLYVIWLLPGYWNLGFTIINTLFLVIVLKEFKTVRRDSFLKIVGGVSLILGIFLMIRSFWFVRFLSLVSIFILDSILVVVARNQKAKLDIGRLVRTNLSLLSGFWRSFGELFSLMARFKDNSKETKYLPAGRQVKKILVGILMSIPLLFVFGVLFYNADPIFAKLLKQIKLPQIKIDENIVGKVISTLIFFGAVGAILRNKLAFQIKNTKWLKSITEVNVAVAILEVLFVIFSAVQINYFLITPEDLKKLQIIFSDYTRSGYGQMIFASILAYLVVLRLEFAYRSIPNKLTKFLVWAMMGEILIFIVAATKRNYVYQSFYGFTEIRLLGFSLSIWLVAMLGLLAYKVWKKRKTDFFTRGIILITVVSILGLNVFDIDGTIVRTKPASLDSGVDYDYMSYLSDDAWQGWEKILVETENNKNKDENEHSGQISWLERLDNKREFLEYLSSNYWSYGGIFNYSNMKSLDYLEKNKTRINDVLIKLKSQLEKEFERKQAENVLIQQKKQEELFLKCPENIFNRLNEYYPEKVSRSNNNVLLKTGLEMGPSEQTLMFVRVEEATGGIKYRWFWTDSNANKTFVRIYTISCIK